MLRFTDAESTLVGATLKLKPWACSGLMLRLTGTSQSGQTPTDASFGYFSVIRQGVQIARVKMSHLGAQNDRDYGYVLRSYGSGAAFDATFVLPFRNPHDKTDRNIVQFTNDDYIELDALSATVFASCAWTLYSEVNPGSTLYVPKQITRSVTLSAEKPVYLPDANLMRLLLAQPSTAPTKLLLERDGILVMDVPYAVAEIDTDRTHNVESAGGDYSLLELGDYLSVRGDRYALQAVGGAGDLAYTTTAVEYTAGIPVEFAHRYDYTNVAAVQVKSGGDIAAQNAIAVTPGRAVHPVNPRPNQPPTRTTDW